jgi:hypothetical protein
MFSVAVCDRAVEAPVNMAAVIANRRVLETTVRTFLFFLEAMLIAASP